ncbi:hypothetical protein NEOLEDRAFT_1136829, partial [Neolentinus lepideus HHB14362 ss-1]
MKAGCNCSQQFVTDVLRTERQLVVFSPSTAVHNAPELQQRTCNRSGECSNGC